MGGYLRPHQIEEIENEKHVIEHTLTNRGDIQDRGSLQAHIRRCDAQIEKQGPPDLTGDERDTRTRECQEIEARLVPLMPSDEEMRRNPAGVVGRHKRYEKASKSKNYFSEGDIFRWKKNQLALHKGDDDPDIANFERMRPMHNHGSMLGAQIPGTQYFGTNPSQAYKVGHDRTFSDPEPDGPEAGHEPEKVTRKKATRKKATRKKATRKKATRKKGSKE